MSNARLQWLRPAPADFRALLRALEPGAPETGVALRRLAQYDVDQPMAAAFAGALARWREQRPAGVELSPFHLRLLGEATFDLAGDHLPIAGARHGLDLKASFGAYGRVADQVLDPASDLYRAAPDAALLALDHRALRLDAPDFDAPERAVARAIDEVRAFVEALAENGVRNVILQTLAVPPDSLFGGYDAVAPGARRAMLARANAAIIELAGASGTFVFDVAAIAEEVGARAWFDEIAWRRYKIPFAPAFAGLHADRLARLIGAIRGRSRKCLVLDLDNTIWGGVVGDDGPENLIIGEGDPDGESFLALQRYALHLRERGIFLAVCSKNDDAQARRPFRELPDMALREEHISVFQANWSDKPSNLEAIAGALNIGLDALVFIDDNPAERAHVRAALPLVAVPEMPDEPAHFVSTIAAAGYFEAVSFSAEDRLRVASQAAETARVEARPRYTDVGDYLASLEMIFDARPFDPLGVQRIAQLVNKSNQFNLTTRRTSAAEIAALAGDADAVGVQARLSDRFGDFGMISVVVCRRRQASEWDVDCWVMSCRVLGRRVEEAMLRAVVERLREKGARRLTARYVASGRNGLVAEHYDKLGFQRLKSEETERIYTLDLDAWRSPELPLVINPAARS